MVFSKGTIKNLNRKLLAGALCLTLLTTGLTGCTSIEDIKYTTNEQGYVQGIDGTVSYNFLNGCHFCKITNNITNEEYYSIIFTQTFGDYYDIFTKQNISVGDFNFRLVATVKEYLIAFNMVKETYTEEDLEEVLNIFIETQEVNKQLVKE